jgi:rhomboid protease GluP
MRQILRQSPATIIIVVLNILFFGASYWAAGSTDEPNWTFTLLQLGALFNPLTLSDEPWRIMTHMFLHGGLLHLAFNQYAFYSLGTSWERYFGWKKWVAIYFVTGFGAALTTLWWNLFTIGVGAWGLFSGCSDLL